MQIAMPTGLGAIIAIVVLLVAIVAPVFAGAPPWLTMVLIAALAVARLT
jgi:hypothetical protein